MSMIKLPGGICFAHGPYDGMDCPKSGTCGIDPQNPEYVTLALNQRKASALLRAAEILERESMAPSIVSDLRLMWQNHPGRS